MNVLPLTRLFTWVCGGRGLPVISQQLKDRQIMIQNTRLGPFKNLSYPDVLQTIFVQKWKDFPVLINQNKTKHLPQHPTPKETVNQLSQP